MLETIVHNVRPKESACVRPSPEWSDLLQAKTKMFNNDPSIVTLHFWHWKVRGQGQIAEIALWH